MRLVCDDPLNVAGRVIDMARRLSLEFAQFSVTHLGSGRAVLALELLDPGCAEARVFTARVAALPYFALEAEDV